MLTITQVLDNLWARYGKCLTYSDAGYVHSWEGNTTKSIVKLQFQTIFVRPNKFRFEWINSEKHGAIWSDGHGIFSCDAYNVPCPIICSYDAVTEAMGAMHGASEGTSQLILQILIDEFRKAVDEASPEERWFIIRDPMRITDVIKLNEETCLIIQGQFGLPNDITISVSLNEYILRSRRIDKAGYASAYRKQKNKFLLIADDIAPDYIEQPLLALDRESSISEREAIPLISNSHGIFQESVYEVVNFDQHISDEFDWHSPILSL